MSRRATWIAAGAIALALLLGLVLWWSLGGRSGLFREDQATGDGERLRLPVELYFPDQAGRLRIEPRELAVSSDPARQAEAVVKALLAGPDDDGLIRPLPEGVEVAGVHLGIDGVAYLDLHAAAAQDPPPSGSLQELLTVYSLVNSVALNVPEAREVVLLWNGSQRQSFAGHVDTSVPLAPNVELVVR